MRYIIIAICLTGCATASEVRIENKGISYQIPESCLTKCAEAVPSIGGIRGLSDLSGLERAVKPGRDCVQMHNVCADALKTKKLYLIPE